jgi:hypothetical protein
MQDYQGYLDEQRKVTLLNMKFGVREGLNLKLASKTLIPPIDTKVVGEEIFGAIVAQPAFDIAMRAMDITVDDVTAILGEVCKEDKIIIVEVKL